MRRFRSSSGPAKIPAQFFYIFSFLLLSFGANADDICPSLYQKSGAIQGDPQCYPIAASNTPIGMGSYYCTAEPDRIRAWCGSAPQPEDSCPVADPVYPASGAVTLNERDYASGDDNPMLFERAYVSAPFLKSTTAIGPMWVHNWQRQLNVANVAGATAQVVAYRKDGQPITFQWSAGQFHASGLASLTLKQNSAGWTLTDFASGITEAYSIQGQLLSETTKTGFVRTLKYDTSGRVSSIAQHASGTDSRWDIALRLSYDDHGRLVRLSDPSGGFTQYRYDANSNLIAVTWPDGNVRQYVYDDLRFKGALTGVIDETGARISTWTYDSKGRATAATHPDTTQNVQFSYGSNSTIISDNRGTQTLAFSSIAGMLRPTIVTTPSGSVGSTWNAAGNLVSQASASGKGIDYDYDDAGRPARITKRTATGTSIISVRYVDATSLLPKTIASPGKMEAYDYDDRGNLTGYSVLQTNDRTGASGFGAQSTGQMRLVGARYDSNNRMTGARVFVNNDKTEDWYYFYDETGNLQTSQDIVSHWLFGNWDRDDSHHVTRQTGDYREARIAYDARGRVSRFRYTEDATPLTAGVARQLTVDYTYSPDGTVASRTATVAKNGGAAAVISGDETDQWLDNYEGAVDPVGPPANKSGLKQLRADYQIDGGVSPVCIECWLYRNSPLGLGWSIASDNGDSIWVIPGFGIISSITKAAANLCKTTSSETGPAINFQTAHYATRLKQEGVAPEVAEARVAEIMQEITPHMEPGSTVWGRFEIDGVLIQYRGYMRSNGEMNVGTIFPIRAKP